MTFSRAGSNRQVAQHREHLRRERLVELDQIEIVERKPGRSEQLPHRRHRADPHDPRIHAGRRPANDPRQRLNPRARASLGAREHHRRAAVGDARRRARGDDAGHAVDRLEDERQLAQAVDRGAGPRMLVRGRARPACPSRLCQAPA